jgi:hypothetical protein
LLGPVLGIQHNIAGLQNSREPSFTAQEPTTVIQEYSAQ